MKAVIFDLDGTLTNTLDAIAHFGNLSLAANGFGVIEKDKYKYLVGDGRVLLIHRMLKCFDADTDENYEKVAAVYDRHYEADPMYMTDAYDGMREIVAKLRASGIKTAVCSNKPDNVVNDVVKKVFGENSFDYVCGVREGMPTKPDPAAALEIARFLGVKPEECIFTGDTSVDMNTAKNAGMTSVGVLWGFRDRAELEAAGAMHIISSPSEYLKYI